jgi:parallel beta-helix repeat protein
MKILYFLVGMFLLIGVASAATYNVPAQYKTIQKAINVAHDGDTIKVASGTYKEYLDINGKQLTLIGSKFPKIYGIRIEAAGQGKIYNFAITKNGIGITDSAGNIIRNCAFTNCYLGIQGGTASDNIILNNKFTKGGIDLYESYDNSIIGNTVTSAKIGLALRDGSSCKTITKNTFKNCQIGVWSEYLPSILIGNTYPGTKTKVKIVLP